EMWIGASRSTMPPGWLICGLGLVWRLTRLMFCTNTRSPATRVTSPRWPLALPVITTTWSPFLIRFMADSLQHFRRQRDDLHEALAAQLARDRPEDAGADRLEFVVEQYGRVAVETDQRAIGAAHALGGSHHHGVVHLALLDLAARDRIADGNLDYVADAGIAALGAAQHLDAHQFLRAAVVRRGQCGLHLDHGPDLLTRPRARRFRPRDGAWSSTSAGIR